MHLQSYYPQGAHIIGWLHMRRPPLWFSIYCKHSWRALRSWVSLMKWPHALANMSTTGPEGIDSDIWWAPHQVGIWIAYPQGAPHLSSDIRWACPQWGCATLIFMGGPIDLSGSQWWGPSNYSYWGEYPHGALWYWWSLMKGPHVLYIFKQYAHKEPYRHLWSHKARPFSIWW